MNDELERIWKEAIVTQSKYFRGICMEGLRKITDNVTENSGSPEKNSNLALPVTCLEHYL
jgi:hypothetical protein